MYELTHEQRALADAALTSKLNVIHHVYVDITGDLIAGALLGQVLYWFGADRNGRSRARIRKDGHTWIAKARGDWWNEVRISAKQYDRAAKILKEKGFIEIRTMKFNGNPTSHIRIIPERLNEAIDKWKYEQVQAKQADETATALAVVGYSPIGNNEFTRTGTSIYPDSKYPYNPIENNDVTERGNSLTENTAKNTHEITHKNTFINDREYGELLFNEIWSYYPRKVGRSKAHSAYIEALGKGANSFLILVETALYNQHIQCMLERGEITQRYIPTGGTWFIEERWNDETPSISSKLDYDGGIEYNLRMSKLKKLALRGANAEGEAAKAIHASIQHLLTELPY